jgi:hypothetical protein
MARIKKDPPVGAIYETTVEYMAHATSTELEAIELGRLSEAVNLERKLTDDITELVRTKIEALLVRTLNDDLAQLVRLRTEALLAHTLRKKGRSKELGESAPLSRELLAKAVKTEEENL